jgi:hypothetical protein
MWRIRAQEGHGFMATVDQNRHYAAECLRLARKTENVAEKDLLLQMAEGWRQLAERAEKEEHNS